MPKPDKTKSTIMVDTELWKRLRIITVLNDMEISEFVEEALREKLQKIQQPEQYQAYKDVENIRLPAAQAQAQPQPEQPSQQQQQGHDIFKDDRSRPRLRKDESVFPFRLPGFTFPASKEKLMQFLIKSRASGRNRDIESAVASRLPDVKKEYSQLQLEAELSRLARHKGKWTMEWESGKTEKIVGVGIDTTIYPDDTEEVQSIKSKDKEKEKVVSR